MIIDQIKQDIQERLEQVLAEADKLRHALLALDAQNSTPSPKQTAKAASPQTADRHTSRAARSGRTRTASTSPRNASGATRATVLSALSHDRALTAGEVADATGLGRASVSTTLSKLAKIGEITKADRGYRLP
jgi:DNA-binding transcriptional ArsR family regulator